MDGSQPSGDGVDTSSIVICWLPKPEKHHLWNEIQALLRPATRRSGCRILDDDELVWLALDGSTIIGASTTRLTEDGIAELIHVGGRRFREWVPQMDEIHADWARSCGCDVIQAQGRKGWKKLNIAWGWTVLGEESGVTYYEKVL